VPFASSCGGEEATGATGNPDEPPALCVPGERRGDDGSCLPPGVQEDGCAAGEHAQAGRCIAAGVPPDACATGFAHDGSGCTAILPELACPAGSMAIPGDAACREVAPCRGGAWGEAPAEESTEFVDGDYGGGGSDGTATKPWTNIQSGVDAAAPGAVVAIAAGSYLEDVDVSDKPVRLWGRCPGDTEIVGSGSAIGSVTIGGNASGTQIRDLAIRGAADGIALSGVQDVIVDRVWIHGTDGRGIDAEDDLGATSLTVARSLIDGATDLGAFVEGSRAVFEASVIRGTRPRADGTSGRGLSIQANGASDRRGEATLSECVIEDNTEIGIHVSGSTLELSASVVRRTSPSKDDVGGRGINAQPDSSARLRATITIDTSCIEENHDAGVFVTGSDATISNTVIRDTQPRPADRSSGRGVTVRSTSDTGAPASASIVASALIGNHEAGLLVQGSDATVDALLVRDTRSRPLDGEFGRGVIVQDDPRTLRRATFAARASRVEASREGGLTAIASDITLDGVHVVDTHPRDADQTFGTAVELLDGSTAGSRGLGTIVACILERGHGIGLLIAGSDATVTSTIVRDIEPWMADGSYGRAMSIQDGVPSGERANVTMLGVSVERVHDIGVSVYQSDAELASVAIRGVRARADGAFGDGVAVYRDAAAASVRLLDSHVEASARAGVSNFSALVALGNTVLACNVIDLNGESIAGTFGFDDLGGNRCGCNGASVTCVAQSSSLAPPAAAGSVGANLP